VLSVSQIHFQTLLKFDIKTSPNVLKQFLFSAYWSTTNRTLYMTFSFISWTLSNFGEIPCESPVHNLSPQCRFLPILSNYMNETNRFRDFVEFRYCILLLFRWNMNIYSFCRPNIFVYKILLSKRNQLKITTLEMLCIRVRRTWFPILFMFQR
jgi:hypothetical protein